MKHTLLIILLLSLSVGFSQQIIHTETYENGNIKSITYHKKSRTGIERVKYEGYYEHGQKKTEGTWKDGERDGLWTWWYENGQKKSEKTYKDGKKDGKWIRWYDNGQKREESTYKDGKEISWKRWNRDGSVKDLTEPR